jgi:hypothetical protein
MICNALALCVFAVVMHQTHGLISGFSTSIGRALVAVTARMLTRRGEGRDKFCAEIPDAYPILVPEATDRAVR